MHFQSAVFQTSAAHPSQFVQRPIPHFVFAGRSNVGKSSLLNKLLNRKNLAKTSQSPGKTRLINYFLIDDRFFFVDIPGYGYAKVSKTEQERWGRLVEAYLRETTHIALIFQLIDIRHAPKEQDKQMVSWLKHYRVPYQILLTKADKLPRGKVEKQRAHIAGELGLAASSLIPTSAVTAQGIPEIRMLVGQAYEANKTQCGGG